MARVMICDDDRQAAEGLAGALRAAGHEAEVCRHTMDMLRVAAEGRLDLVALGLDMAGFGRAGAVEALSEVAPRLPVVAMHSKPAEIMRDAHARFAAVLPRPVEPQDFIYAVARALAERESSAKPRRRGPFVVTPALKSSVG